MNFARLPGRDRRALLLGALVVLPLLLFVYAVRPAAAALKVRRSTVLREREALARDRALAAALPDLPRTLETGRRNFAAELERAIVSEEPATAGVTLAGYVRNAARANQVLISQAGEAPGDSLTPDVRVARLSVRGESDFAGILRFVHALESGPLRTRVSGLHIEHGNPAPDADTESREILTLTMTIEAPVVLSRAALGSP